jgi:hypothetical protein
MTCHLSHNAFSRFSIAGVVRLRPVDTPFPRTSPSQAIPHECYTLVISIFLLGLYLGSDFTLDRNRAVPIACPISQLRRVLNLCSCYLPGHIIRRQYPHECYTLVISFFLGSDLTLDRNRAVPIACPISQLHRVPNLCSFVLLAHTPPSQHHGPRLLPEWWRLKRWRPFLTDPRISHVSIFSTVLMRRSLICHLSAHLIRRQYPHERYTPVIPFFSLGLYLGFGVVPIACPISQLHHVSNFELSSMANPST